MSKDNNEIDFVLDDYEILLFFERFKRDKSRLWLWQVDGHKNRIIHYGRVKLVNKIEKMAIMCSLISEKKKLFHFDLSKELFFYHESKRIAGKLKMKMWTVDGGFSFELPETLNVLSEGTLKLLEQEAEEKYQHLRVFPRKKIKGLQFASILKIREESETILSKGMYALYDLSAGGMAFWIDDPGEFVKGDLISFFALDGKDLSKSLTGEVVALRLMEGENRIKVSVKFIEDFD